MEVGGIGLSSHTLKCFSRSSEARTLALAWHQERTASFFFIIDRYFFNMSLKTSFSSFTNWWWVLSPFHVAVTEVLFWNRTTATDTVKSQLCGNFASFTKSRNLRVVFCYRVLKMIALIVFISTHYISTRELYNTLSFHISIETQCFCIILVNWNTVV